MWWYVRDACKPACVSTPPYTSHMPPTNPPTLERGVERGGPIGGEHVGVRAEEEEVVALLDGDEARARDDDGGGAGEALDGGAHGGLELPDLVGCFF